MEPGSAAHVHSEAHHGVRHGPPAHRDEHAGHDRHAGHSVGMFRTRFWVALILTIPTVVGGHMLTSVTG